MEERPRTWKGIKRKFHGRSGLFAGHMREWIRTFFKGNEKKREEVKERYFSGAITNAEFENLLSNANRYIPAEELTNFQRKYLEKTLTEAEVDYLLKYAIPDVFLLKQVMGDLGIDYNDRHDYTKAILFFKKERELTQYALDIFWDSEEYQRYASEGYNDEDLWRMFMYAAFKSEVYPLWADPADEHRYKMLELPDYIYLLTMRRKALHKEALRRTEEVMAIEPKISILSMLRPLDGRGEELRPYETLKLNPPKYECPLCHKVYISNEKLAEHLERIHGAK